jgi:hypothetical protein
VYDLQLLTDLSSLQVNIASLTVLVEDLPTHHLQPFEMKMLRGKRAASGQRLAAGGQFISPRASVYIIRDSPHQKTGRHDIDFTARA